MADHTAHWSWKSQEMERESYESKRNNFYTYNSFSWKESEFHYENQENQEWIVKFLICIIHSTIHSFVYLSSYSYLLFWT